MHPSVRANVGAQSSALSISMEGRGHDVFLYWIADCMGHEGEGGMYRFVNGRLILLLVGVYCCCFSVLLSMHPFVRP